MFDTWFSVSSNEQAGVRSGVRRLSLGRPRVLASVSVVGPEDWLVVLQKALLSPPHDLIVTWSRPPSDRSHSLQKRVCAYEGGVAAAAAAVLDLPLGVHSLSLQRPRPPICASTRVLPLVPRGSSSQKPLWTPASGRVVCLLLQEVSVFQFVWTQGWGEMQTAPGPWGPLEAG